MVSVIVEHDDAIGICHSNMTSDVASKKDINGRVNSHASISLVRDITVSASLTRDISFKTGGLSMIREYLNTLKDNRRKYNAILKEKEKVILHQIHLIKSSTDSLKLEAEAIRVLNSEMLTGISLIHEELAETKQDLRKANSKKKKLIDEFKQQREWTEQKCQVLSKNSWTLNLRYFGDMLGLKLSHEGDTVMVDFNRLSQGESVKDGSIALKLVENKLQGLFCVPCLQQFETLIYQLNEGLDFGTFLCLIRNGFKELV